MKIFILLFEFMNRIKQVCNVCKRKTIKVFKCKDCESIICLECGKYYETNDYCVYCQSDVINTNFTRTYYYKNF